MKNGHQVVVRMVNNTVLPWGIEFEATLLNEPQGAGDTFGLLIDGVEIQLNGNSSEFVALWEKLIGREVKCIEDDYDRLGLDYERLIGEGQ